MRKEKHVWHDNVLRYQLIILCLSHCIFFSFNSYPHFQKGNQVHCILYPLEIWCYKVENRCLPITSFPGFCFLKVCVPKGGLCSGGWSGKREVIERRKKQPDSFPRLRRGLKDYRSFVRWKLHSKYCPKEIDRRSSEESIPMIQLRELDSEH